MLHFIKGRYELHSYVVCCNVGANHKAGISVKQMRVSICTVRCKRFSFPLCSSVCLAKAAFNSSASLRWTAGNPRLIDLYSRSFFSFLNFSVCYETGQGKISYPQTVEKMSNARWQITNRWNSTSGNTLLIMYREGSCGMDQKEQQMDQNEAS